MHERNGATIRNIAEVLWETPPEHYDAHSKMLVNPRTVGSTRMELDGERTVVRGHDVIHIPPGVEHAIYNSGLRDLVFLVITTPPADA